MNYAGGERGRCTQQDFTKQCIGPHKLQGCLQAVELRLAQSHVWVGRTKKGIGRLP